MTIPDTPCKVVAGVRRISQRLTLKKRPRAETIDETQQDEERQKGKETRMVDQKPNDDSHDNIQHSSNEYNTDPDSGIVPLPPFPDPQTELHLLAQYHENERWERELQEVAARADHVEHADPVQGSCSRVRTLGGWVWARWNGAYYLPIDVGLADGQHIFPAIDTEDRNARTRGQLGLNGGHGDQAQQIRNRTENLTTMEDTSRGSLEGKLEDEFIYL